MRIAFIGFGEAGRAFAATLGGHAGVTLAAHDKLTEGEGARQLRAVASEIGVELAPDARQAALGAELVFSAVTASDCIEAARSLEGVLVPGQTYLDINSVSPGRKNEAAGVVASGGAAYVDMAVMAPVHPRGHRTPALLAGDSCNALEPKLRGLGFDFEIVGQEVGEAAKIKLLRSFFVKGLEALTVQTLLAARAAGRYDEVYRSLAASFGGLDWPNFPRYQLSRVREHGIRRAAEMVEAAATQDELGFADGADLARAVAAIQDRIGRLGPDAANEGDLSVAFDALASRLERSGP